MFLGGIVVALSWLSHDVADIDPQGTRLSKGVGDGRMSRFGITDV